MMEIGIDVRSMFGTPTGVGRYLSNLLNHISRLDKENSYCLYTDHPIDTPIIQQSNFCQKHLTFPFVQNYFTWNHFRLPLELLQHPVDLFHFPFYTIPVFRNYRTVVTIHDITYEIHPEWYSWKGLLAMRFFSRYAAKHADRILTDSNNTKQDIINHYKVSENKIAVIYLGVEERFGKIDDYSVLEQIRAKYQIASQHVILYVGSIHTRRNIEQLIRAIHILCRKMSDIQLLIVGKREYPYFDVHTLVDELALNNQVILSGYIQDSDLPLLYNVADLFIYPSSYEGFGLPPLEAMACGTPVITSNNSSLPEVAGEAAMLIDPLNVEEMAEVMYQVLSDESLRRDLIVKGIAQASKFSWEQAAKETLSVYQEVGVLL
jgi:glycosyltransferase involved in cell wall biosynthesis